MSVVRSYPLRDPIARDPERTMRPAEPKGAPG
jgi:hypothetical protein